MKYDSLHIAKYDNPFSNPIDKLTLADNSPFQVDVIRYGHPFQGDGMVLCALIEEILRLQKRIEILEKDKGV